MRTNTHKERAGDGNDGGEIIEITRELVPEPMISRLRGTMADIANNYLRKIQLVSIKNQDSNKGAVNNAKVSLGPSEWDYRADEQ